MGAAVAVPAILGGVGLIAANEQARKAQSAQNKAIKAASAEKKPIVEALYKMLGLADNYNPSDETNLAVQRASEVTQNTIGKALGNLNAQYRAGGGVPGNSSEFNVRAQGMTDRVTDPLREFVAQQYANEFQKKMAAYAAVNGGNTGNLSSAYFQAAQMMPQPNYNGGLNLMSQALSNLMKPKAAGASGAGGSGDTRTAMDPGSFESFLSSLSRLGHFM